MSRGSTICTALTSSANPFTITLNITTRSVSALLRMMITSSDYMWHIALTYYGNSWCVPWILECLGRCGYIRRHHRHLWILTRGTCVGTLRKWGSGQRRDRYQSRCRLIICNRQNPGILCILGYLDEHGGLYMYITRFTRPWEKCEVYSCRQKHVAKALL